MFNPIHQTNEFARQYVFQLLSENLREEDEIVWLSCRRWVTWSLKYVGSDILMAWCVGINIITRTNWRIYIGISPALVMNPNISYTKPFSLFSIQYKRYFFILKLMSQVHKYRWNTDVLWHRTEIIFSFNIYFGSFESKYSCSY